MARLERKYPSKNNICFNCTRERKRKLAQALAQIKKEEQYDE